MIIKSINYLRFGILFARLKKEERRDNSWFFIRFMSQIACVSHCVGLSIIVLCVFVSNRVPLCGFENCFYSFFYAIAKMLNSPFSWAKFWGVDWPPRPPSNTANMYRKISAVIMALQGAAGGRPTPQNFAWKKGEF